MGLGHNHNRPDLKGKSMLYIPKTEIKSSVTPSGKRWKRNTRFWSWRHSDSSFECRSLPLRTPSRADPTPAFLTEFLFLCTLHRNQNLSSDEIDVPVTTQ